MKEIKLTLSVFALALMMLAAVGASQDDLWNLGSSDDWLSTGPLYHVGPFYYPNSDLPMGTQQFLNTYPNYTPLGYPNYYPTYNPAVPNATGTYTPSNNQLQGYNPYFYDPQAELDLSIANHAYQKFLTNYHNRYYGIYPY